uniref:Putative ovule protein n=1 Tax=Solanum chacoense TaxID=4108 RepID=A0A0V0IU37_SOLCH
MNKSFEFIGVIEACGLTDLGYTGLPFTWCNQRDAKTRVWKRLDWSMVNDKWLENMPQTTIENLSFVGSDHSPLLMEMIKTNQSHTKYFKFLHCWVDNGNFMNSVQQCWEQATTGDPMWKFHMKMKRLTSTLSKWSKQEYGDIFTKGREFEETIRKAKEEIMTNNADAHRQRLHQMNATYIRYLKLEENILKQKTQLQWFQEGDANTKYFHALMRGRRRRIFLHKICIENEVWIQGEEQIAQAACDYYQHQFTGQNDIIDERILQYIPTIITPDQNEMLQAIPNIDELRKVVFAMNPYSAAGPDGFGGKFYQVCWSIIKEDLLAAVQSFFCGHVMPKFMSHACLVLLPKTEQPSRFTELRPISLSNFTNKIISRVLSMRLATVLPLLVSDNQSGFVRGRSITESIMLAQEITQGIKKPHIGSNVVIKLDMAKAYDRVSWSFTCLVLRRFGFGEIFIDLVWRLMSNNWYSIIINGHRQGFFPSTRGLKQGDPLSPALFILGAEVLTRMLNSLHQIPNYKGFFMGPKGPQINHLSFADDVIIFASTDRHSLKLIMETLGEYEHTFGQLINKSKSHFMVPDNTSQDIINNIQECTNLSQKCSPITYLGCPQYIGRQKIIYYSHLVEKVSKKVCGWQARILSFGGRITLIKHAIQSIPIHTMAAISPPNTAIKYIEAIIADFFWGRNQDKKKYHWASLDTMSLPCTEGGVGMRRLTDICTALQYKQWWTFRSKNSLWSQFLKSKYCQRAHPVAKKVDNGQSLIWKYMMRNKIKVEEHIGWTINSGSCSFWWDDWLGVGALANYTAGSFR